MRNWLQLWINKNSSTIKMKKNLLLHLGLNSIYKNSFSWHHFDDDGLKERNQRMWPFSCPKLIKTSTLRYSLIINKEVFVALIFPKKNRLQVVSSFSNRQKDRQNTYRWVTQGETTKVEIIIAITKIIAHRLTFKRTLSRTWRWYVVFLSWVPVKKVLNKYFNSEFGVCPCLIDYNPPQKLTCMTIRWGRRALCSLQHNN